ncbi:MAG: selenoprotein B glycine/betaine/sarcosine/D-proline reductase, partial [Gammaproteobacteria bacterium]|nr:selenoprotein B glycine/betaine/sarcosine/D-proline reductase [Gammaproteobacteria bacterium]
MVRLIDLPEYERDHLLEKNMQPLGTVPWHHNAKPLSAKRIALITTAGLHFRGD